MEAIIPPPQATFDSQQAPAPEQIQPSSNLGKKILIVCAVLIFGVVAGVVGYLMGGTNTPQAEVTGEKQTFESPLNDGVVVEDSEELQQSEQSGTTRFAFIRDHAVWISEGGTSRQVSKDGQAVERVAYDARSSTIAYTWGDLENNGHASYTYPHTVTIIDLTTQSSREIYHEAVQKGMEIENPNYILDVVGVLFSRNGRLLVVTTSDSMYLYDREKTTTSLIRTNRSDPSDWKSIPQADKGQVYGYRPVAFSPSDTYLLAESLFSEWTRPFIVDLEKSSIIEVKNNPSNREFDGFDWKSDSEILFKRYRIVDMGSDNENTVASMFLYNLDTQAERELSRHTGQISAQTIVDTVLYYAVLNRENNTYTNSLQSIDLTNFAKNTPIEQLKIAYIATLREGRTVGTLLLGQSFGVGGPSAAYSIYELNLNTNQQEFLEENASF